MEHPVQADASTSNSTPKWKYDVFLSFAGKDTRLKFTNHLYEAFNGSEIKTFMDDVDLERGADIKENLFQAIQDSLCAVLVISEHYANSTWCLEELQKIYEFRNTLGRRVFPIFYDVDPSDVRHQRKSFGEAMAKHEKELLAEETHEEKFIQKTKKLQNWKNVLFKICNLSGWDSRGKHEADLIKNIVGEVQSYLNSKLPPHSDNLVGIDSRVRDMMPLLEIGLVDKRFVGIWGMGGVGKTTLARYIAKKLSDKFQVCCFLDKVRETLLQREGLVSLQKKLLSDAKIKGMEISDAFEGIKMIRNRLYNTKVLVVLDDVDHMNQLKNLAESPDWFGEGSRIIITTRDRHLLTTCRVEKIYEMKIMKEGESLELFSNKAFNKDHPEDNYMELSKAVLEYAGGLPLALEVLGSFLYGRSLDEWRDALKRLKQIPDKNILEVLKLSYDVLNEEEKTIFLDIACFFKGWKRKEVTPILKGCDLHPTIGIKVLIEKTLLIETEACTLEMHDLLQDLGRYIVRQESPDNVGKRSRLWKFEDIREVLENNKGSEAIQAIVIPRYDWNPYYPDKQIIVHPEAISKMSNIRLLLSDANHTHLIFPRGLKCFGDLKLKVIIWTKFPFDALPLPLKELVHIEMPYSHIKQLWYGEPFMNKLKFINLSNSGNFAETPNFSRVPYLEYLCLRDCGSLVKIHHSLGELEKLIEVHLHNCVNLVILPSKLETNSLKKLDLRLCGKVAMLPKFREGMEKLSYLDVSGTAISKLPESVGSLTSLLKTHITHQISALTELHLRGCGLNDRSFPENFGSLSSLIVLDLSGNDFVNLPTGCFSSLFQLLFLSLDYCTWLKSLPRLPPQLIRLDARYCDSMEPLSSDRGLWNLVASLDHENRGRTKYVITDEEYVDVDKYRPSLAEHVDPAECLPLRDFCAVIQGNDIPSWFPNKQYYSPDEKAKGEYVIKVNIPPYFSDREWSGIVVCMQFSSMHSSTISWSSKAPEGDDYYMRKGWGHHIEGLYDSNLLCTMVLELNEKTCWQHLRPHDNSLHIKLYPSHAFCLSIRGCGWRVISKEDIQEWCTLNDFNQVTHPQLAFPQGLKLPCSVLGTFIRTKQG